MILPFIRDFENKKSIKEDIKDNILSKEEIQQEADSLNAPVDTSYEQSLLQSKVQNEAGQKTEKDENQMQSLKWKKADKRQ